MSRLKSSGYYVDERSVKRLMIAVEERPAGPIDVVLSHESHGGRRHNYGLNRTGGPRPLMASVMMSSPIFVADSERPDNRSTGGGSELPLFRFRFHLPSSRLATLSPSISLFLYRCLGLMRLSYWTAFYS